MIGTIHQPHFLPWIGYFNKLLNSDIFIVLDDVQFRRRYFQNRTDILSPNGEKLKYTVPIKKVGRSTIIREIHTSNEFQVGNRFLKTLYYSYKKTPFFEKIFERIEQSIISVEDSSLLSLNMALIRSILDLLEKEIIIKFSSNFRVSGAPTSKLVELSIANGVTTYIFGEGNGISYHDLEEFKKENVGFIQQNFMDNHPVYPQKSQEFIYGLSIIDLLFHVELKAAREMILTSWSIT